MWRHDILEGERSCPFLPLFIAQEWLAAMCSHIPNRGEQMVRYYGYYSKVSRGKRQQEGIDDAIPWSARSLSPRRRGCQGAMRIISFIEDQSVIRDILNHLGLWLARARPLPKAHASPIREYAA